MEKSKLYTITVFCFACASVDFLTLQQHTVFPRDRIIHLLLSLVLSAIALMVVNIINPDNKAVKLAGTALIICRSVYMWHRFSAFFNTFHGADTLALSVTTVLVIVLFCRFYSKGAHLMYSFFAVFNVICIAMIVFLSYDRLNVMNIYSNSTTFGFSPSKLFIFFDIITIALLCSQKQQRLYIQKRYLALSAGYILLITLLEGLSVSGNMMYSLSPLQAIMQIFTAKTVKRFDFAITVYFILNYYAAILLYTWTVKRLLSKEVCNEDI